MAGIDSNTLLMLHLNGNVTDSSQYGVSVTNTNATFSNTSPKFVGTEYAVFNGTDAYIQTTDISVTSISGNQTIDMWVNYPSLYNTDPFWGAWFGTGGNNFNDVRLNANGSIMFLRYSGGSIVFNSTSSSGIITTNTWYHIAIVRNGSNWTIYVNGVSKISLTDSTTYPSYTAMNIGVDVSNDATWGNPKISEFRVSNVARWTSNFTPPTMPYSVTSPNTGMFTLLR